MAIKSKVKTPVKKNKSSKKNKKPESGMSGERYDDGKEEQSYIDRVRNFWNKAVTAFTPDYKRAFTNIGLVFDNHWDGGEEAEHFLQDRTPLNMPGLFAKVLSLLGFEKNNREVFESEPAGEEDELTAQIFNQLFKHIENSDDPKKYEYTKSDVFFDGIIPLFGCAEIYTETDELGNNEIKLRQIPYNEVVYNKNFTDVEMTACDRQQHGFEVYTENLKLEYPDKAALIDAIPVEYLVDQNYPQVPEEQRELFQDFTEQQKKCMKIRDWKRVVRNVYELHCIAEDTIEEYFTMKEADERRDELIKEKRDEMKQQALQAKAMASIAPQGGALQSILSMAGVSMANPETNTGAGAMTTQAAPPLLKTGGQQNTSTPLSNADSDGADTEEGEDPEEDYIIKTVPKSLIEQTVIAGNVVLEEPHLLEVDEFPLTFYFSIFLNGRVITIIDIAKHLQQYFDKMFSQMDKGIGEDTKTSKVLYAEMVDENYQTVQEAIDAVSEGDIIVAKGMPGAGDPVQIMSRSGVNNDFFKIFELLLKLMEDAFGGRNFQGAEESGGQSGKAIAKLQAAAALISLNYMDNLRRFDMQVGKKLVKYIKKFYTQKMTIKAMGQDLSDTVKQLLIENGMYKQSLVDAGMGWITVNDEDNPKNRPLSDANLSIVVNRVNVRQDEKDVEYEKLLGLKQLGYVVPVEAIVDTMNLKATLKNKIIKANEAAEAMQQRQMALQEKQAELQANQSVAGQFKDIAHQPPDHLQTSKPAQVESA